MKIRVVIFVGVLAAIGALVWWQGGSKGVPMPPQGMPAPMGQAQGQMPHAQGTALPTIKEAVVKAQDSGGREYGPLTLKPGKLAELPGTAFSLKMTEFYTQWNWDVRAVNLSFEEKNPAVKIEVWIGDDMMYSGWGFKNIPFFRMGSDSTMHPGGASGGGLAFTLVSYEGLKVP